jgi:UDP-GlcNAc:undecaprenyl-phosphate GlcNAc-1-phosphate transferase
LIGIIGVQGSLKGPSTISILFPILAMGLPISDTAMAIFRRWVRNLPLSSADRRHVHHLLIGLGLNPRQAAVLLYCFSGFLCGAVLLGVSLRNEMLALVLGLSGCLAFLLILTSRMDEFANLRGDFMARIVRGRQERAAAKLTWEAIQRIELCDQVAAIRQLLEETAHALGCQLERISCTRHGSEVFLEEDVPGAETKVAAPLSGPSAVFRLSSGKDLLLTVALHQASDASTAADIAFRFLQRLSLATAERIERLLLTQEEESHDRSEESSELPGHASSSDPFSAGPRHSSPVSPVLAISTTPSLTRVSLNWLRMTLGWSARPVVHHSSLGDK